MKVAVLETEASIDIPLVVPIQGVMTVVDRLDYESVHKKFHLVADKEGKISEDPRGTEVWLPKDTDISKLRFVNGQLIMIQEEPKEEKPKTKPKKETKKVETEA